MKEIVVRHDSSTSNEKAPNGQPWIEYWQQQTKLDIPKECPCCKKKPTEKNPMIGAHVIKVLDMAGSKLSWTRYITPTCDECNKKYKGIKATEKVFSVLLNHLCETPTD